MSDEEEILPGPSSRHVETKSTCKQRKDLPLKVQVEVLTKLMAGAKQFQLAQEFCVSQSQISRIKSNQERILCQFINNGNLERKRARMGPQKELEEALLKWYQSEVTAGTALNGVMIKTKANQIAKELGLTDWKASKGWYYRWQLRNNAIVKSHVSSAVEIHVQEGTSTGGAALLEFREVLGNYSTNNIFCMDEATLLYRTVPSKEGQLYVDPQERVSILFCANRSGTSLMPPVLIGRTSEPACLKGVKKYPVLYTNSPRATMTSNIFHGWLQQIDAECGKSNKKIALVADDIPAHRVPQLVLKNVRLVYLPYHIRPLEKLISKFKLFYREQLVRELAVMCDHSLQRIKAASTISLLRCMHFVKLAWGQLTATDVSRTLESLVKTVLGVNLVAETDILPDVGKLPFDFNTEDLKLVEQLEKKMELEQDSSLPVNESYIDDQFTGSKLVPPSKQEVHSALEVLRRFHDLNGFDPQPLYQVETSVQRYMEEHGLLPQTGLAPQQAHASHQQMLMFPSAPPIPVEEVQPQLQHHQTLPTGQLG
ncbi:tigger transposable element-derived protein 4 [Galendromus occidentalis]|uniref:Tigger transposable element-derived protein 4 n=1 Tax=Galendromus occidentalis TaxID=34638 RepID=A0AAJ6QTM9_9ACAR|nr:tigger transposable element-derived protein 4 [Galendromus occidentalis]